MALGPQRTVEGLLPAWPAGWYPQLGRRPEALLRQERPIDVPEREAVTTRWARPDDVARLTDYRIAIERDSGTTIVSTVDETTTITSALVQRQAVMVVEVAGELAGCAAISTSDDRYEQLGFVYVEPQHRLQRVSDRLLAAVCVDIHRRGRRPVTFTAAGGRLYDRLTALGFNRVGDHLKLYFGPMD